MTKAVSMTTVSNTAVLDLLETCGNLGLINEKDLDSLNIHRSTLNDPALRFPENKLINLWNWLAENSVIPEVGLLIGQTINPSAKGLLASWVSQAESLGEALEIFRSNISLMNPSEHWDVEVHDGRCCLQFSLQADKAYPSIAMERSMSAIVTWGRVLSAFKFSLIETHFSFSAPRYHAQFVSIFGKEISFDMPVSGLIFDRQLLKLPVSGNQFLKSLIEDKASSALHALNHDYSIKSKTKHAIEKIHLRKHTISIDAVCDELAISRQTLYRKLKEEKCDYKSLSDDYKKSVALKLLQTESENISGISLRLGYKDTSSFYKAFKRWFGITPKSYLNSLEE
jgi:AraC-like DNA-binding protein